MRFHMAMMLHTHLDTIMTGALLALAIDLKMWEKARSLALHPIAPIGSPCLSDVHRYSGESPLEGYVPDDDWLFP